MKADNNQNGGRWWSAKANENMQRMHINIDNRINGGENTHSGENVGLRSRKFQRKGLNIQDFDIPTVIGRFMSR